MPFFEEWESFYVIVGTASAALIGLQFVVMALIADRPQLASPEAGAAFATPTIVHFSVVLLLSALLRVPFESIATLAAFWGFIGLAGLLYGIVIARRMRRQKIYQPDWEDWISHLLMPLVAYAILLMSFFVASAHAEEALFAVAAATLLLLFIGIHNVWDTVAYQVFVRMRDGDN